MNPHALVPLRLQGTDDVEATSAVQALDRAMGRSDTLVLAMFDPQMQLLSSVLATVAAELAADATNDHSWNQARRALEPTRAQEPELAALIDARDLAALRATIEDWRSGKRLLPKQDREVLSRAMKAFRKSLKVTRLDAESTIGGGPMSSGRHSGIAGMRPPDRYTREVWDELARQKRLVSVGHGIFELPPE